MTRRAPHLPAIHRYLPCWPNPYSREQLAHPLRPVLGQKYSERYKPLTAILTLCGPAEEEK
jgi:hypothetical protein